MTKVVASQLCTGSLNNPMNYRNIRQNFSPISYIFSDEISFQVLRN